MTEGMVAREYKLLLVEDSQADAELIVHELARGELVPLAHRVDTIESLRAALEETWDVVIADDALPGFNAAQTLALVSELQPTVPVIVVSGVLDEEAAVAHLRSGARDFVTKQRLSRLTTAVERELDATRVAKARLVAELAAEQLAAIVASSSDAIYGKSLSGEITSWNASAARIFGYPADEIIGTSPDPTVPAEGRQRHDALCARVAAGEVFPAYDVARMHRSGEQVEVQLSISAIRDEDGRIVGISTSARDVTDQRRAARVLAEHDKAFEAIFEGALDAMLIADDGGTYLAANRSAGVLLGLPREALIGRRIGEFVGSGSDAEFTEFLARGESTGIIAVRRADGDIRLAEYSATADVLPGRHLSILRDVTERIGAERLHRESESKFRAIFEHNRNAILLFDDDFRWLDANPAAATLFGLPREQLLGEQFVTFSEPDFDLDSLMAEFLRRGDLDGEWTVVRADGERRCTEYSSHANLVPGRHLAVIRDVTESRLLEDRLRQAQKLEAVGQLAGGIAHDFNNFLTAIAGYSDLALDDIDSGGESARANVEEIRRAADRAAQLTQQLLAFSRRKVLQRELLDLNEIVGEYAPMLARILGEHVSIQLALDSELQAVLGDRGQLGQVIINLAVNARDAMPGGGTLTLRTRQDGTEPSTALLAVTDTGVGIDEPTRARLFEPFFTTKPVGQGTGLGLATVLGIVEQSGGSISVDSELGVGTTFTVALPSVDAATLPIDPRTVEHDPNGTERILVVEDDPSLGEMFKRMLEARGYEITLAQTPIEALALAAGAAEFELLVTDVVMPELNGRQLAERLLVDRPDLRVLYTSGYSADDLLARGVFEQSVRFLHKPFSVGQLAREVRCCLDEALELPSHLTA